MLYGADGNILYVITAHYSMIITIVMSIYIYVVRVYETLMRRFKLLQFNYKLMIKENKGSSSHSPSRKTTQLYRSKI